MKPRGVKANLNYNFQVQHSVSEGWNMKEFHFHDAFEIYFAMTDGIQYFVEDEVYSIKCGDLLVFNKLDLHKTVVPAGCIYERYVATFMPEYVEGMSSDKTDLLECYLDRPADFSYRVHLDEKQQLDLISLFDKAIHYSSGDLYGADIYLKLILTEILLLVNSFYRNAGIIDKMKPDRDYKRVKQIIQYIHMNLGRDLSLDTLSRNFFMSKYHLNFLFKKVTGFTINEYIIRRRIQKACELLKDNITVSQVGEMVGYFNDSHFIRTFKKLMGVSPKQYSIKYIACAGVNPASAPQTASARPALARRLNNVKKNYNSLESAFTTDSLINRKPADVVQRETN